MGSSHDCAVTALLQGTENHFQYDRHTFSPNEKLIEKYPSHMQPEQTLLEPKMGKIHPKCVQGTVPL